MATKETSKAPDAVPVIDPASAAPDTLGCESGHLWALPEKNPFNGPTLECVFACKRCGAPASFTISVGGK